MKKWIRRSFRNRIFLTVLLVTLLPLLFCNVLMMQMQVVRSEISLAQEARAQLTALDGALDELCLSFEEMADELCESTAVRSVLRQKSADSRVLYQLLFRVTDELRSMPVLTSATGKDCAFTPRTPPFPPGRFIPTGVSSAPPPVPRIWSFAPAKAT